MAGVVLLVSLTVMLAWWVDYRPLLSIVPGTASMKFNTALSLSLSALAMFASFSAGKPFRFLRIVPGLLVFLIGGLVLLQYILDISLQIDNLLLQDEISARNPGRMSPATAFCLTLIGLGILGQSLGHGLWSSINPHFFHAVSIIALVSLLSYLMQIPLSGRLFFFRTMAIHTSISLLFIATGLSLVNPSRGFARLILGKNAGSRVLRQLFPFVVLSPFVLGYLLILLSERQLVNQNSALVLLAASLIILSLIYVSFVAQWLNQTDQRKIELQRALLSSNENLLQYKQALDAGFIISISDAEGNITHVNDNFCDISGYHRDELIGQNYRIVKSDYHDPQFFENMWKTTSQGKMWSGEICNQAKDESSYWLFAVIVPFRDQAGEVDEYVSICYNITAQKESELKLKTQYVHQLETKNQELEQFAYIASHDLQEPLRTITNFSNVLHGKYTDQLDSTGQKSLEFILNATQRMRMLVSGLLTYSRIGSKRNREPVNLNEQLKVVMEDMHALIREKQARIEVKPLPRVQANALEIRMIFQNLINNAIKFQPEGQLPLVKIFAEEDEFYWKISVSDNGIGISPEYREKIFMIFQRLHPQGSYQGSGIGLAHCRKIAEQHGGQIWVDSGPGRGSTFYFTISKLQKNILSG